MHTLSDSAPLGRVAGAQDDHTTGWRLCWCRTSGVSASFGEMLLLMAIHFHSNQLTPIADLVCSTLGMKIPIRPNSLAKMKTIFTQELFTDQVVTAHAVKVAVTPNLNANTAGFLPVHCIYQLLKSRAFTKHKVRIKDWVFKQICASRAPLHPILPALVEVYVNSVIVPSCKSPAAHEMTNEPLSEEEIASVFGTALQDGTAPSGAMDTQGRTGGISGDWAQVEGECALRKGS